MKRYRITKIGKIFFVSLFLSLLISFFLNSTIFIVLLGFTLIAYLAQVISVKVQSKANKEKLVKRTENILDKKNYENVSSFDQDNGDNFLEERIKNNERDLQKDIKENEKLEEVLKETENLEKVEIPNKDIDSYFDNKKEVLDESFFDENETEDYYIEEETFIERLMNYLKRLIKFKKYHEGDLIIHEQFGIGEIVEANDVLTVSFMNDNYREKIQFEYDSKKKIPEISLFKVPRGEEKRNYYYDYREDISENLKEVIDKIKLNFENIYALRNIYLKIDDFDSFYDLIVINNKVNIFNFENESELEPLKELIENYDLDIEVVSYNLRSYKEIEEVLLNSSDIINSEMQEIVRELIESTNIVDFSERKYNLS